MKQSEVPKESLARAFMKEMSVDVIEDLDQSVVEKRILELFWLSVINFEKCTCFACLMASFCGSTVSLID